MGENLTEGVEGVADGGGVEHHVGVEGVDLVEPRRSAGSCIGSVGLRVAVVDGHVVVEGEMSQKKVSPSFRLRGLEFS